MKGPFGGPFSLPGTQGRPDLSSAVQYGPIVTLQCTKMRYLSIVQIVQPLLRGANSRCVCHDPVSPSRRRHRSPDRSGDPDLPSLHQPGRCGREPSPRRRLIKPSTASSNLGPRKGPLFCPFKQPHGSAAPLIVWARDRRSPFARRSSARRKMGNRAARARSAQTFSLIRMAARQPRRIAAARRG